ncbi:outer membrane beta-barrel protein [Photobacterium carnosum]|uniref:outer membrane beta-barrel protein n=1 Tax=Photobacterium carnosum TaxID=2023717 RepID=UPI002431D5DC|nr:outer membrane beta-barrel protein [Photobacterium carnosum]
MHILKKTVIAISCFVCPIAAQASENYISVGATHLGGNGVSASGGGFSWASFGSKEQNVGFIVTSSLAKEDVDGTGDVNNLFIPYRGTLTVFDINVGPIFKVQNLSWLRLYPLIGISHTNVDINACLYNICASDNESKNEFNYGVGLQLDIPTTNIYTEFNIKRVMGDFNKTNMYFGVGYHLSNTLY